jgi:hypothetical protein
MNHRGLPVALLASTLAALPAAAEAPYKLPPRRRSWTFWTRRRRPRWW